MAIGKTIDLQTIVPMVNDIDRVSRKGVQDFLPPTDFFPFILLLE
jgi:hypothetical protein